MKKYVYLVLILFISSLNFNLILKPLNLVTGGTNGLSILFSDLFNIKPSIIILIIDVLMLIISFIFLSNKSSVGSLLSTFIYPLLIRLTSFNININLPIIILVLISGIISGITCAFIYKLDFTSGGINILSLVLNKKYNVNIAISNFIINFIIILFGAIEFGILKLIYSILIVIINSIIINIILS